MRTLDHEHGGSVAIVDDDQSLCDALQDLLKEAGIPARTFTSAEEFLGSGQQHLTSCLIIDVRMPGMSGLDVQARLFTEEIRIPIIFVTAHDEDRARLQVSQWGGVGFLVKPFDDELLLKMVRAALELWTSQPPEGRSKTPGDLPT